MEQIEKLKEGRKASKLEHALAQLEFQDAYAAATEEQKALVDGYIASSRSESSANARNNKDVRDKETQIYRNAILMMNGTYSKPMAPTVSKPNIFGGYSHQENVNDADAIASNYLKHNRGVAGSSGGEDEGEVYNDYIYEWNHNLGWGVEGDSLADRIKRLSTSIVDNLSKALDALRQGYNIRGVQPVDLLKFSEYKAKLEAISSLSDSDPNGALKSLLEIAPLVGMTEDQFNTYFNGVLPGSDKITQGKKALTDQGYEFIENGDYGEALNKLIADKGYHVAKKGSHNYLVAEDYSDLVKGSPSAFVDTDWRNGKEGFGYAIDENGAFEYGDLNDIYADKNNAFSGIIQKYLDTIKNNDRWFANERRFNKFTSTSDFDLINNFAEQLQGENGQSVIDVSRYFDGADVVATVKGNNYQSLISKYGHLKLDDPNVTFYYKDKNGEFKTGKYSDVVSSLGDLTLNSDKAMRGLANYESIDFDLEGLNWADDRAMDDLDINRRSEWDNWWSANKVLKNKWNNETSASDTSMQGSNSGILNSPGKFARLMLYAFANLSELERSESKDDKELSRTLDLWLSDNTARQSLLYTIYTLMKLHPEDFKDPRYRIAFLQLLRSIKGSYIGKGSKSQEVEQIVELKRGGILMAKSGAGFDSSGNPIEPETKESIAAKMRDEINPANKERNARTERAKANGRNYTLQKAVESNEWTSSDTLRCTALATDIVGLIGAIAGPETSGIGSFVAIGSGFASMVLDAVADFKDDKVSSDQAWKNVAINSALAAGSFLGAKAPKMVAKVTKMLPRVMTAIGTAGVVLDPEVQKTVSKVTEGKDLDVNDWRNLSIVLRTAIGIGTTHVLNRKGRLGAKKADELYKKNLEVLTSDLDPNIKYVADADGKNIIPLHKNTVDAVKSKLKSGKKEDFDAAIALLTKLATEADPIGGGLSADDAKSVISTLSKKKSWKQRLKFWKDAPEEYKLNEVAGNPQLEAAAKLKTIEDIRTMNLDRHSFKSAKWLEAHTEYLNPALNRMLYGTGYRNIRKMVAGENEKIGPINPYSAAAENIDYTKAERSALRLEIKSDLDPTLLRLRTQENIDNLASKYKKSSKSYEKLDKRVKIAEEKRAEAEAKYIEAQELVEQTKQAFTEETKPYKELKKLQREAQNALATAQKDLADANTLLADAISKLDDPRVAARNGGLDSKGIISHNQTVEAERQRLGLVKVDALLAITDAKTDPILAHYFDEAGNPKVDPATGAYPKQILDLYDAEATADTNLQKYLKANPLKEEYLWRHYYEPAFNSQTKANDAIAKHSLEIADLKSKVGSSLAALRSSAAKANFDSSRNTAASTKSIADLAASKVEALGKSRDRVKARVKTQSDNLQTAMQKVSQQLNVERLREYAAKAKKTGIKTSKEVTVKIENRDVNIPENTEVKSYKFIRDANKAKEAVLSNPNMKELTKSEIKKLFPANAVNNIRGAAFDSTTNEIAIWKIGGLIKSKYSHLRK